MQAAHTQMGKFKDIFLSIKKKSIVLEELLFKKIFLWIQI